MGLLNVNPIQLRGVIMFCIKISDIVIGIENRYPYVQQLCRKFIVSNPDPTFTVSVTAAEIEREQSADAPSSQGYCESLALYRKISQLMLNYDAFLMHAAIIAIDDKAYAFAARSGTGKTTHIRLWQQIFGDRVRVVNGDKPIIRKMNGTFYACGTPWCGKEGMGEPISCPLQAICFVERGPENHIRRLTQREVIGRLFHQLLMPQLANDLDPYMNLIEEMLLHIDYYLLTCTPEPEAAMVAYEGMVKGHDNNKERLYSP